MLLPGFYSWRSDVYIHDHNTLQIAGMACPTCASPVCELKCITHDPAPIRVCTKDCGKALCKVSELRVTSAKWTLPGVPAHQIVINFKVLGRVCAIAGCNGTIVKLFINNSGSWLEHCCNSFCDSYFTIQPAQQQILEEQTANGQVIDFATQNANRYVNVRDHGYGKVIGYTIDPYYVWVLTGKYDKNLVLTRACPRETKELVNHKDSTWGYFLPIEALNLVDIKKDFPHSCPRCKEPCINLFSTIDCVGCGKDVSRKQ
jgi:hypothetical protein